MVGASRACKMETYVQHACVMCVNTFGKPEGKRPIGRPRRKWDHMKWILIK
jgi:hypothetical protein